MSRHWIVCLGWSYGGYAYHVLCGASKVSLQLVETPCSVATETLESTIVSDMKLFPCTICCGGIELARQRVWQTGEVWQAVVLLIFVVEPKYLI